MYLAFTPNDLITIVTSLMSLMHANVQIYTLTDFLQTLMTRDPLLNLWLSLIIWLLAIIAWFIPNHIIS